MENFLLILFGSVFIAVGVLVGTFFIYRIYQAHSSTRWPSALGKLESIALRETVFRGIDSDGSPDLASALVTNFKYSYIVAGKEYHGTRVTYSDGVNKTVGSLRKLQKRYKGKSQIQVYYNPQKYDQSLLVPGATIFNYTPLITCSLFIISGVFITTL